MDDLNTLELLKSLTLGVNNKINQEQDSEIEYIVSTSLSNKKKKSAPPIIKEVVKEKKSTEVEIIEDEVFYEPDIIEESFDIIEESEDIVNDLNTSEESFERFTDIENDTFVDDSEEDFLFETKDIEADIFIENEVMTEEVIVDNTIIGNDVVKDNAVDSKDSGHISEELAEKKKKIERNGNPFKRGPRKKKDKVEKVEPIIETTEIPEDTLIDEIVEIPIETNIIEEVVSEDYLEELHNLDDSEFDSLFSDFNEDAINETEDITEIIEEEEELDDFDDLEISEVKVQNDFSENEEKNVSDIGDFSEEEDLEVEGNNEVEEVVPIEVEEVIDTKDDLDFLNSLSKDNISEVEVEKTEEIKDSKNEDEDAKFKDCIYHRGMSVEEFLRENPNYRDALYVEHFFSKEELNKLIVSGLLLMKKGKYRL